MEHKAHDDIIHELENMTEVNKDDILKRASSTDIEMFLSFFNKHTMNMETKEWAEERLRAQRDRQIRINTLLMQTSNFVFGIIAIVAIIMLSEKFLK